MGTMSADEADRESSIADADAAIERLKASELGGLCGAFSLRMRRDELDSALTCPVALLSLLPLEVPFFLRSTIGQF
jgi:hypothetical protein